ncbi:unnamed protein product [Leptosia nina]|uniref:Uncharacterized protein n=1 Tax=Leptosia nina TaxID=320188 RepID=A0AAV1JUB3_9NEOP
MRLSMNYNRSAKDDFNSFYSKQLHRCCSISNLLLLASLLVIASAYDSCGDGACDKRQGLRSTVKVRDASRVQTQRRTITLFAVLPSRGHNLGVAYSLYSVG